MDWSLWAADLLAIAGTLVLTLAVIGIVREPNPNVKIHATSLAAMLGLPLVLGAALFSGQMDLILRAMLVGVFSGLTSPIGTHELARLERGGGRASTGARAASPADVSPEGPAPDSGPGDGARVGPRER